MEGRQHCLREDERENVQDGLLRVRTIGAFPESSTARKIRNARETLGDRSNPGELMVAHQDGVHKTQNIRRKPLESRIDAVQRRFLRECGLSDEDALLHFHLAALETRRDIALLLRTCFCDLRRRFPRIRTNNFKHCKFCRALHFDSLMSTICYSLRWLAERVWPQCSTNCIRF